MNITEEELEDYLYNNPEKLPFCSENSSLQRQVDLGDYGRADLLGLSENSKEEVICTIVELKVSQLMSKDYQQVSRYHHAVRSAIPEITHINSVLIGPSMANDVVFILTDQTKYKIMLYELDIEKGITFKDVWPESWFKGDGATGQIKKIYSNFICKGGIDRPEKDNG